MDSLKEAVLTFTNKAKDDDTLIQDLNKLAKKNGDSTYQKIIQTLAGLELTVAKAKKAWFEIIEHRKNMSKALKREVRLIVSIGDYFSTFENSLKQPKLIELNTFEKAIKESTHDSLTGIFNKTYCQETMNQQISFAKRQNSDLSILFLDIDDFKDINDTFGHQSGDMVLTAIAQEIANTSRSSDIVSRFGGEEFVVLMPNTSNINALIISERIRKNIEAKNISIMNNKTCNVTISGGLVSYPSDAKNSANLLAIADQALYRAKGAGKNNISIFREDKRRFLRIKFNRSIKVKELGFNLTKTQSSTSKDISIGGILFESKKPLPIGNKVQVSMPISDKSAPLLLIGTIVRVEAYGPDLYDIGMILSFKEMEKTAKKEISKFLIQDTNSDPGPNS